MNKKNKPYTPLQAASAIFMIMALLWLTVSLPFVYESQQKIAKADKAFSSSSLADNNEEEAASPLGAEEKNPGSNTSISEEYLHDHHVDEYFFSAASQFHKCENSGVYIAYHGELDVPPPDNV